MSLYPSLEDMQVDKMAKAQTALQQNAQATAHAIAYPAQQQQPGAYPPQQQQAGAYPPQQQQQPPPAYGAAHATSLYPSLDDYMGLALTPEMIAQTMPMVVANPINMQVAERHSASQMQVAPITGNHIGVQRSEIKQGIREVILCKDQDGKIGLRVRGVSKGLFVAFVHNNSPAALAGLRFGDQILQINDQYVAGWDTSKGMKYLEKCGPEKITMAIRDRPFERTITMQKDSVGTVGFVFKENKITAIVKDSSAARNGVLIDHHLVEVNGQNVVGLKEKEIKEVFDKCDRTVTITIVPSYLYEHIIKSMGSSLIKKHMDHSIPDV